jgi:hypothetical protein
MTGQAGVWIDHRKAVIVALTEGSERTSVILSRVEKHPERSGDSPMKGAYEARQVPADDSRQRALTGELNIYYDAVNAALSSYQSVLIFGPGEAKGELHQRMLKKKHSTQMVAIETADKMTDPQVAAKVRHYFAGPNAATPR